jgi:hypothetical protein
MRQHFGDEPEPADVRLLYLKIPTTGLSILSDQSDSILFSRNIDFNFESEHKGIFLGIIRDPELRF